MQHYSILAITMLIHVHTYTALPTRILRVHEEHLVEVMIDVFVTERHEVDLLILTQPP